MESVRFDAVVIGGGEAGLAAAIKASELGARVCLGETSTQLGGACVATKHSTRDSSRCCSTRRPTR